VRAAAVNSKGVAAHSRVTGEAAAALAAELQLRWDDEREQEILRRASQLRAPRDRDRPDRRIVITEIGAS
jgi:hypothetical protein